MNVTTKAGESGLGSSNFPSFQERRWCHPEEQSPFPVVFDHFNQQNPVVGEIEFVEFIDYGHRLFVLDGVCRDVTACRRQICPVKGGHFALLFGDNCEAAVVVGVRQLAVIGDIQFEIYVIISGVYTLQEYFHCLVRNSILSHDEIPLLQNWFIFSRFW